MKKSHQIYVLMSLFCLISILSIDFSIKTEQKPIEILEEEPKASRPLQNYTMNLNTSYDWIDTNGGYFMEKLYSGMSQYLPFSFPFYEETYNQVYIDDRSGMISFYDYVWSSSGFPDINAERSIAIFSSGLDRNTTGELIFKELTSPNRLVIIYANYSYFGSGASAGTFEIIIYESGLIKLQYKNIDNIQGVPFCGVNRGEGDNYFNSYNNLNTSITNYSIDFVYPSNINAPKLTDGNLTPTIGNQSTLFTYTVNYSDADNHPPLGINVTINGTGYQMWKQNPSDINYVDGCIYEFSTYLQSGNYSYSFTCWDGDFYNTTTTLLNPSVNYTNTIGPLLNSGQVNPISGYKDLTLFNFSVNYSDSDNNAPNQINITLDGSVYNMTRADTMDSNYMDGCTFQYLTTLNEVGYHQYYFNCSDGLDTSNDGPYSDAYVEPIYDYANLNLTGFRIGAVLNYSSNNPFDLYPVLRDDLVYRGAELYNITESLNSSTLANYDLIWLDDFGFSIPANDLNDIYDWVNNGGTIFVSGNWGYATKSSLINRFNMSYYDPDLPPVMPEHMIYGHPITKNVNQTYSWAYHSINISSQPNATSCIDIGGHPLSVALEQDQGALAIINDVNIFQWNIDAGDNHLLANNTFGWLYTIANPNDYWPALTDGQYNPASGNQSTLFTFTVNYTDFDNNNPEYVNVIINGTQYPMYKQTPSDTNYTDGCIYEYSLLLNSAAFAYVYNFNCSDGGYFNYTSSYTGPLVSYFNYNPPNLTNGNVTPTEGEADLTVFTFTVNYSDQDNNFPVEVNLTLDGLNYTMSQVDPFDNNYTDGCVFEYNTTLGGIMTHEYNFTVFDGDYYAFNGTFYNPKTNDTIGPIISNFTVLTPLNLKETIYNFTVELWDYSGISSVVGYIQYQNQTLIQAITFYDDGTHNDGGIGDGLYGADWNSTGYDVGTYFIDLNATDSSPYNHYSYYDNLTFAIVKWGIEIYSKYYWNVTVSLMSPDTGMYYCYNITDLPESSGYNLSIWGNASIVNPLTFSANLVMSNNSFEFFYFPTQQYFVNTSSPFAFLFPFAIVPINLEIIKDSLDYLIFGGMIFPAELSYANNCIRYEFTYFSQDYVLIFQFSNEGVMNYTLIELNGIINLQYNLLDPSEKPALSWADVIPTIAIQGTFFNITAEVVTNWGVKNMTATITYPDFSTEVIAMYDDGTHNDGQSLDKIFGASWNSTGKLVGLYNITINITNFNDQSISYTNILSFNVTLTDTTPPYVLDSQINPLATDPKINPIFDFTADIWDDTAVSNVTACIKNSTNDYIINITMYDDGIHNDGGAGDGTYGNSWNSSSYPKGVYYIDIYCNDTISNEILYENEIIFLLLEWNISNDEVLIYNVTENSIAFLDPMIYMPTGTLYRADITNINSTYSPFPGPDDNVSRIWGRSYESDITLSSYTQVNSLSGLIDLNFSLNYYRDTMFYTGSNLIFATIIPTPVCSATFEWLERIGVIENHFSSSIYTYTYTNSSINIYNTVSPSLMNVTIYYNQFGVMTRYFMNKSGQIFDIELIVYELNNDEGSLINSSFNFITENFVNFTITYVNLRNIHPIYVDVNINTTYYRMSRVNISDFNFTDGVVYNYIIGLGDAFYDYFYTYFDGKYSSSTATNQFLVGLHFPKVTNQSFTPSSGNQTTIFTFFVNYSDEDNDAPLYVNVVINGMTYAMQKQNASDTDYTDGCIYNYTTLLSPGAYTYYSECHDGMGYNKTATLPGPNVININLNAPTLSGGQVVPAIGERDLTLFNFSVIYTDIDNFGPTFFNLTLDGVNYTMTKWDILDNDYTDGCLYVYTTTISSTGSFDFNFTTSDGMFGAFDGTYAVVVQLTNPPVLSGASVSPTSGQYGVTVFNFTVTYTDADNHTPSYIRVEVDGTNYTMEKADPSDLLFTDGCLYYYNDTFSSVGNLTYIFYTYDGVYYDQDGPYTNLNVTAAPILSNEGVTPDPGEVVISLMEFTVEYTDYDDDAPLYINITINGTDYVMQKLFPADTDYTDGCIYYFNKTFSIVGIYIFNFTTSDGTYTQTYGNFSATVQLTNAPVLSDEQVSPPLGEVLITMFNFTVNYTDADNHAPTFINITLGGNNYTMTQANISDTDYTDGCIFYYASILNQVGVYQFNFTTSDGLYTDISGTSIVTVQLTNPPTLTSGQVNPQQGVIFLSIFNFTVNYIDIDNHAPSFVNITLDGTNYTMTKVNPSDTDYTDGCLYNYTVALGQLGLFEFNFSTADLYYSFNTGSFTVNVTQANPPTLTNTQVDPISGQLGVTLFNFSVNYTDSDNLAPLFVNITLDGVNYTMSKASPADNNYTNGCIYYYNTTLTFIGAHEYNYTTTNGGYFIYYGTFNEPFVSAAATLTGGQVSPAFGEVNVQIFNFSVIYTDLENDAPLFVNLTVDGLNLTMAKVNPLDVIYTDGCEFFTLTTLSEAKTYLFNFTCSDGTYQSTSINYNNPLVYPSINWSCQVGVEYHWYIIYSITNPERQLSHFIYNVQNMSYSAPFISTAYGNLSYFNISKGLIESVYDYSKIEDYNAVSQLYYHYKRVPYEDIILPFIQLPIDLQSVNESLVAFYFQPDFSLTPTAQIYTSNNTIVYNFSFSGDTYKYILQWNESGVLVLYKHFLNGFLQYHLDLIAEPIIDIYDPSWVYIEDVDIRYVDDDIIGNFNLSVTEATSSYLRCASRFEIMDDLGNTIVNQFTKHNLINNSINPLIITKNVTALVFGEYYYKLTIYYYDGSVIVYETGFMHAFELYGEIYYRDMLTLNLDSTLNWDSVGEIGSYLTFYKNTYARFTFTINNNVTAIDLTLVSREGSSYIIKFESNTFTKYEYVYMTITGAETIRLYNIPANTYNISLIAENTCQLRVFNISTHTCNSEILNEGLEFIGVYSPYGYDYFVGLNGTSQLFSIEFNYSIAESREILLRIINLTNRAVMFQENNIINPISSNKLSRILITVDFPFSLINTMVEVNLTLVESGISVANLTRYNSNTTLSDTLPKFDVDIVSTINVFEQSSFNLAFWETKQLKEVNSEDMKALEVSNITILEIHVDQSGRLDNVTISIDIKNKFKWYFLITSYSVCYDVFISPVIMGPGEVGEKHIECLVGGEEETLIIRGIKIEYINNVPTMNLEIKYRKSLIMNLLSIGLEKILPAICPIPTMGFESIAMDVADLIYDMYLQCASKEEYLQLAYKVLSSSMATWVASQYGISGTDAEIMEFFAKRHHSIFELAFDWIDKDPQLAWKIFNSLTLSIFEWIEKNPSILEDLIIQSFAKIGKSVAPEVAESTVKTAFKIFAIADIIIDGLIKLYAPDEEIKTIRTSFNDPYPSNFSSVLVTLDPVIQINFDGPTIYSFSNLVRLYNIIELNITSIIWNSTHSFIEISALTNPNYTGNLQIIFEDLTLRNSLLSIFSRDINISYFVKNGNILSINTYVDLIMTQTTYSINNNTVSGFQEFHFDAIQLAPNHYQFNHTFNYMENETFINQISLILPDGVYWIQSNVPYISWVGNIVTWDSNITNLLFEFKIESGIDDEDPDVLPPINFLFLIIIVGALAGIATTIAVGYKKKKSKSAIGEKDAKKQDIKPHEKPQDIKKQALSAIPALFPPKKEIINHYYIGVVCSNCEAPYLLHDSKLNDFHCKKCKNQRYNVVLRCLPCQKVHFISKAAFYASRVEEKTYCPTCNRILKLVKETIATDDPEYIISLSQAAEPKEVQAPVKKAITKREIGMICSSCSVSVLVKQDEIEAFKCPKCSNPNLGVVYRCSTCNKIRTVPTDKFIENEMPNSFRCKKCKGNYTLISRNQ